MEIAYEIEFPNSETKSGVWWTKSKIRELHPEEMTTDEYDRYMDEFGELLKGENYSEFIGVVSAFQRKFMEKVLRTYERSTTDDAIVQHIVADIVRYAIWDSESGNSIYDDIPNEKIACDVRDELWNEFGDMLLDCDVYPEGGTWTVDAMFGGSYVPWWDGWGVD